MKKIINFVLCITLLLAFGACREREPATAIADVERGFCQIPDSVDLAVYWYWVSDNVSVEGVERDLEAMKEQGITRAFISHIYIGATPAGDVEFHSEQWWAAMHAALKRAAELDIEIGVFNSPGWSQSGGPWVSEEQSMRYLALESHVVEGGESVTLAVADDKATPEIAAIAYPLRGAEPIERCETIHKRGGEVISATQRVVAESPFQTLVIECKEALKTSATLYATIDGVEREVRQIEIERSNKSLNVGFDPLAPVVIALGESGAREYRLSFAKGGAGEMEVRWSSRPQVERYPEKSLAKMFPRPLPAFDSYMWAEQAAVASEECVSAAAVIDLTDYVSDGELRWSAPEGDDWVVMTTAMRSTKVTNSPASKQARGLEIDKMSKEHIRSHFDSYIGEILRRIPEEDRSTFRVVVMDSYETGGLNWTDDMAERFEQVYGYDPTPYLPTLSGVVVESKDLSDRFLWDLRRLIADRVSYDYVAGLREVCHENGLTTWLENYGHWGFPSEFLQYGGESDEVAGEFWSKGSLGNIENRAASSCCHIYGKRKVWAESCTVGRGVAFELYPYLMKQRVDRFFTEGINATLLHLFIHQPSDDVLPGINSWFGNDFNRNNTWFSQLKTFGDYLKRCNFMLQQGDYIADVAYFIGEDAPKMTGVCNPALPRGYSFDYINADILLSQARVEDGVLTLDSGMRYRVLVLPELKTMRVPLLKQLVAFAERGLTIVGELPVRSPSLEGYPASDSEVQKLSQRLATYNIPNNDTDLKALLSQMGIKPDFSYTTDAELLYIHRQVADGDIYFVSNQEQRQVSVDATFRSHGGSVELWYPTSAEQRVVDGVTRDENTTQFALQLAPLESVFVVFRSDDNTLPLAVPYDEESLLTLEGEWSVDFVDRVSGEVYTTRFAELHDWITSDDERVKYFSGEATYSTTFTLNSEVEGEIYIDMERVAAMAQVSINGNYAGGVWAQPYRVNITDHLRRGENRVEIKVVNCWRNRLIREMTLPKEQQILRASIMPNYRGGELTSSGVIGRVRIIKTNNKN